MSNTVEVKLPDIGDFEKVDVIEVQVAPGDRVEKESPLITLESDKATMEIPSPLAGRVSRLAVKVGDKITEGDVICLLDADGDATTEGTDADDAVGPATTPAESSPAGDADVQALVVVLGAGPGGYTAAFRAADLGLHTVLVEKYADLGGVCLNVGCIPSKALLHTAEVITEAAELAAMGVEFGEPRIDLEKLRSGKDKVVKKLTGGLAALAKQRKVDVVRGTARFESPRTMLVKTAGGEKRIAFDHCIIACGSRPVQIPGFPHDDPRVMDSTGALELADMPGRLLVIGGGIIGLEMATVYSALGSTVDIVELQTQLMPGADPDLVKPLQKRLGAQCADIMLGTKVIEIKAQKNGLKVSFEGKAAPDKSRLYDRVLVSVGRVPNGNLINAEAAGVAVDERGFIPVDQHMQTNVPHIYAIGVVVGNPMLAHKATHEGKVAAEVISGRKSLFDPMTIPSVAYTDPEVAWMGLTELEAKAQGIAYEKGVFPWAASGRALGIGRDEGFTKLLFDAESKRILGAGIVGVNAGDLIAETVLALEMGAVAEDIGLTIHPHPSLVESIGMAAEMAEGTITDLMPPRRRK